MKLASAAAAAGETGGAVFEPWLCRADAGTAASMGLLLLKGVMLQPSSSSSPPSSFCSLCRSLECLSASSVSKTLGVETEDTKLSSEALGEQAPEAQTSSCGRAAEAPLVGVRASITPWCASTSQLQSCMLALMVPPRAAEAPTDDSVSECRETLLLPADGEGRISRTSSIAFFSMSWNAQVVLVSQRVPFSSGCRSVGQSSTQVGAALVAP